MRESRKVAALLDFAERNELAGPSAQRTML